MNAHLGADLPDESSPMGAGGRLAGGWVSVTYAVLALAGLLGALVTPWLWISLGVSLVLVAASSRWAPQWKALGIVAPIVGGPIPALAAAYGRFNACVSTTTSSDTADVTVSTSCTTTVGGQLAVLVLLCLVLASAVAIVLVAVHGDSTESTTRAAGSPTGSPAEPSRRSASEPTAEPSSGSASEPTAEPSSGPTVDSSAPPRRRFSLRRWLDAPWAPVAYGILSVLGIVAGTFWPLWICLAAGLVVVAVSPRFLAGERLWGIVGPAVASVGILLLNRQDSFNPTVSCTQSVTTTDSAGKVAQTIVGCGNPLSTGELVVGFGLVMLVVIGIALTVYIAFRAARRPPAISA